MDDLVIRFREFYKGRRVLVTGDSGFKGSWLALWLHDLGAEVLGVSLQPEKAEDHFNALGLDGMIRHVTLDIRDQASLTRLLCDFNAEYIFHLAAQPLVRYSYANPVETFETNVIGSVNLLEAARQGRSLRSLVFVTSDKCYKNREWHWGYRENDELGGRDPYSASKAAAEIVFQSYVDSFFSGSSGRAVGTASVRAGNVIGGGDWSDDRIVPDCIRALLKSQPIVVRNPGAVRPWQHVLEPLSGYLWLGGMLGEEPEKWGGSWNFGPEAGNYKSVHDLANAIVSEWGSGEVKVHREANSPHEAMLLYLNCDKARQVLRWTPRWDFGNTLRETTSWYKAVACEKRSAVEVSREQIAAYCGRGFR